MIVGLETGLTNRVKALNLILAALGSVGINSEDEIDYNIDAANAANFLDIHAQEILANGGKGWWFNREKFHKIEPNPVTGELPIPRNTLSCFVKRRDSTLLSVSTRGNLLFDNENLGYDMRPLVQSDGRVHLELVVNLPFDSLPVTAIQAITDLAAFNMQSNMEGDATKIQVLKGNAERSYNALQSEHFRQQRSNLLTNKYSLYSIYRIGGLNNV